MTPKQFLYDLMVLCFELVRLFLLLTLALALTPIGVFLWLVSAKKRR